jgi:dolichyldiphosphatase
MPSDHAQFMFFAASYALLFTLLRWGQPWYGKLFYCCAALVLAVVVSLSRVYLMYHTAEQIAVGSLVGICTGTAWFILTEAFIAPVAFPRVAGWDVSRFLLVRDCSHCPDVLTAEYLATNSKLPSKRS